MVKCYLLLADGFETVEALTPVDILRRCSLDIKMVSITDSLNVTSSHGVTVKADMLLDNSVKKGDLLILPGGYPGYENLRNDTRVIELVQNYFFDGKRVAAICGAPTVLLKAGVGKGMKITCHTSVLDQMKGDYCCTEGDVEIDGNIITGKGAGLSLPFALSIAGEFVDSATMDKIKAGLQVV